ncbi:MAG: 1-hydroxycarotenoid 3,4-desaturase CrtD [Pseudomonadota bacterium]
MLLKAQHPTIIVGAGMAGLAAGIALAAKGEPVTILEARGYPGGKMRQIMPGQQRQNGAVAYGAEGSEHPAIQGIDSGPTVFTMKWVFERLFALCGTSPETELNLTKASTLARHAWDGLKGANGHAHFDLFADEQASIASVGDFFGAADAAGFARFCTDSRAIYTTLRETFIAAQRPSPIALANRVGWTNLSALLALRPMSTLWSALGDYFPDPRLRQLFGRYATYVGSSPYQAPATLMLIAHVEQDGVWTIDGGMHALARAMQRLALSKGATIRLDSPVASVETIDGKAGAVTLDNGERINAGRILWCGDISALRDSLSDNQGRKNHRRFPPVPEKHRSLSAITWSAKAKTSGFALDHHNVFFSPNYRAEFDSIFRDRETPADPTVYLCAQDRRSDGSGVSGINQDTGERMLCLTNAPAFGDRRTLSQKELATCQNAMIARLSACGLTVELEPSQTVITQPSTFNTLFPGSGGALYGRASHGWMASFARPGAKTAVPGLYLAGGSVHPGPGVPMATLSGMLAAQQILADRVST